MNIIENIKLNKKYAEIDKYMEAPLSQIPPSKHQDIFDAALLKYIIDSGKYTSDEIKLKIGKQILRLTYDLLSDAENIIHFDDIMDKKAKWETVDYIEKNNRKDFSKEIYDIVKVEGIGTDAANAKIEVVNEKMKQLFDRKYKMFYDNEVYSRELLKITPDFYFSSLWIGATTTITLMSSIVEYNLGFNGRYRRGPRFIQGREPQFVIDPIECVSKYIEKTGGMYKAAVNSRSVLFYDDKPHNNEETEQEMKLLNYTVENYLKVLSFFWKKTITCGYITMSGKMTNNYRAIIEADGLYEYMKQFNIDYTKNDTCKDLFTNYKKNKTYIQFRSEINDIAKEYEASIIRNTNI